MQVQVQLKYLNFVLTAVKKISIPPFLMNIPFCYFLDILSPLNRGGGGVGGGGVRQEAPTMISRPLKNNYLRFQFD